MTVPAPGGDYDDLYNLAQAVLDNIVGVYEQAGVSLPARRYVHFGAVAADCEQLTVQLDQHYFGTVGGDPNAAQSCESPRAAVFSVLLFRPEPVPAMRANTPPSPDALNEAAHVHMRDAYLLMTAAGEADKNASWGQGFIAEVSPVDASGGFVGIAMSLSLQV